MTAFFFRRLHIISGNVIEVSCSCNFILVAFCVASNVGSTYILDFDIEKKTRVNP